jgi:hypothetical protein
VEIDGALFLANAPLANRIMPSPGNPSDPPADQPSNAVWWLCSHLVSVSVLGASVRAPVAVLEEISPCGMRLAIDERIAEGTTLQISAATFEVQVAVIDCRVRSDDFCLETRFERDFRWSPDLWTPDHLYRPPARRAKAAGSHEST